MSSILPSSNFSLEDYKIFPNESFSTLENITQFDDNSKASLQTSMWLDDQQDRLLPFTSHFDNNFLLSENNTNNLDCYSSNSNSIKEFSSFENSCSDYYNSQIKRQGTNSTGSTTHYNDFESTAAYNTLQDYVPSYNNYAATPECWGFQGHTPQVCGSENNTSNNNTKVGKYSVEERKDRILRYLKKRNRRNFRKTIKYACRKTLADRRIRIRGRFAKNQEEESSTNFNHSIITEHETAALPFHNADYKKEQNGDMNEEWLQETMASLLYVPCISGWHPELYRS
ncbi:Zinc finger protein CONSTANS-LIKE 3 [Bienertia sinuspersici]